jgi:hypothetical protein
VAPRYRLFEMHTLLIGGILCSLISSGFCWYQRISDSLGTMRFTPIRAEECVSRSQNSNLCEKFLYNVDFLIAAEDPFEYVAKLDENHKFKFQGVRAHNVY